MTPAEKDALGRAILRELRSVERFLRRIRAPESDVEDLALDAVLVTYRKIKRGILVLPDDPGERGAVLRAYLRKTAFNRLRERHRAGDMLLRLQPSDVEPAHLTDLTIDIVLELASALRAQTPLVRRRMLVLLETGNIREMARDLGMSESNAYDTLRRAQERVTSKKRPPRGRNRPKK